MASPLHVIYDSSKDSPSKKQPEIDIIAVHGLNFLGHENHAEETWTKNKKLWLSAFLPDALSKPARIMLFSYNSSPAIGASATTVEGHAKFLLQALSLKRKGDIANRPIVFISHSLGGIVTKCALVEATLDPKYISIEQSTRLLVFFATPHCGGNGANFGDVVAGIVRFGLRRSSNRLVNELKKSSETANMRFEQARHLPATCLIISFCESDPLNPVTGVIVDRSSALLGLPGNMETQVELPANHSEICKFDSAEACELVLETIEEGVVSALDLGPGNKHWLVPRSTNPLFTGREAIVTKIVEAITLPKVQTQRRFILTGMGGQGKSEICLQVASTVRERFWAVFWVDVSDGPTAQEGFSKIAKMLGSPSTTMSDALSLLSSLPRCQNFLLILDNADDPSVDYQQYFPSGDRGAIILTSRNSECGKTYQTVGWEELDNLNDDDCIELFLKAAEITKGLRPASRSGAASVVKAVGSHTLAILQAGAYIAGGYCTMEEYPTVLEQNRKKLMQFHKVQDQPRYRNAYATLEASMQILEKSSDQEASNDACQLLQLLSEFQYENLPLAVLQDAWNGAQDVRERGDEEQETIDSMAMYHVDQLPDFLCLDSDTWQTFRLTRALNLLGSLALVRKYDLDHNPLVSMHPLTHSWASIRQTSEQKAHSLLAAECVVSLATFISGGSWRLWKDGFGSHLLHLLRAEKNMANRVAESRNVLQVCIQTSHLLSYLHFDRDLDHLVGQLFNILKLDIEKPTEEYRPLYAVAAKNAYRQGRTLQSVRIMEIISQRDAETLSETDEKRLTLQFDLAKAYLKNDQALKSISILENIVRIEKTTLEEEHPDRIMSQHELASAYLANGQTEKAIDLLKYITEIEEKTLDEKHPGKLTSQHELARAYMEAERLPEAIRLLKHVVEVRERTLRVDHPYLIMSRELLDEAYDLQKNTSSLGRGSEDALSLSPQHGSQDTFGTVPGDHVEAVEQVEEQQHQDSPGHAFQVVQSHSQTGRGTERKRFQRFVSHIKKRLHR